MKKVQGNRTGILLTVIIHSLLAGFLVLAGMQSIPPLMEPALEIEFEPEDTPPAVPLQLIAEQGEQPRSPMPVPEKEPELVQLAKAPRVTDGTQRTRESTPGDQGDVEIPNPQPPVINERALFRSRDKDTTAGEQTARLASDNPQAGHAGGNILNGNPAGTPSAQLEGRSVVGKLPLPEYTENTSGKVVVKILVDTYGKVTAATPGIEGTTVQNRTLWEAARKAALQARFNVSGSAPAVQEGKITYIFSLR